MEGLITLTGKMTAGYEVTVTLPCEWLHKFSAATHYAIANEFLCPSWGSARLGDADVRKSAKFFAQLSMARAWCEQMKEMILVALEAENEPGLMETVVIPLK